MPRRTLLVLSLFLVTLLLLQGSMPIRAPESLKETEEQAAPAAPPPPPPYVPVGVQTSFKLNYTCSSLSFGVTITQRGVYGVNASFKVDNAEPGGLSYGIELSMPRHMWIPMAGDYFNYEAELWDSASWNNYLIGQTSSYSDDIIAVYPDVLILAFEIPSPTPISLLSANFTVSQLYSFASAPTIALGTNGTLEWTHDDTWKAARFTLPSNGLYNLTAYAGLDWSTTAGWPGNIVEPFNRVELIDLTYGEIFSYISWNPAFEVPPGSGDGSDLVAYSWYLDGFAAADYYLVGRSDAFEYLNSTALNFTLNIKQVPTLSLAPNSAVQLSFSITSNVYDVYVAVSAPQGYYHDLYFDTPTGANWSALAFDAVHTWPTGPMIIHTRTPTQVYTMDIRLERSWSAVSPGMMMAPPVQLLAGNLYTEGWAFESTLKAYDNGTLTMAEPPGTVADPPTSRFNTYFLHVQASPYGTPTTDTFNVSLVLDATPFATLTTSGLTLSFDETAGVFYHILQLPETSGNSYTVGANATKYTTSGDIAVEDMFGPAWYADWQWIPYFLLPLGESDPSGWDMGISFNSSGLATLHYVAVREGTGYLMIYGPGMTYEYGTIGGDMTEARVTLTVTPPTSYALGTDVSLSLHNYDFRTCSLSVIAGYSYAMNLSIDWDGIMAVGYFFNDIGQTPFITKGILSLAIAVSTEVTVGIPLGVQYYSIFTAKETGTITFAIVALSNVHFSIDVIDQTPPTVQILSPANGAILTPGTVPIHFTATDDFGASNLTLTIDGTPEVQGYGGFAWNGTCYWTATAGVHMITLTAIDTHGNIGFTSIAVLVRPDPDSYDSGHAAGLQLGLLVATGGIVAAAVICFLLGWVLKRRSKG